MRELITRWLRSIFGLSGTNPNPNPNPIPYLLTSPCISLYLPGATLRQIRRESPPNVVHLCQLPQDVLLRWFSEKCPRPPKTLRKPSENPPETLRKPSENPNPNP